MLSLIICPFIRCPPLFVLIWARPTLNVLLYQVPSARAMYTTTTCECIACLGCIQRALCTYALPHVRHVRGSNSLPLHTGLCSLIQAMVDSNQTLFCVLVIDFVECMLALAVNQDFERLLYILTKQITYLN